MRKLWLVMSLVVVLGATGIMPAAAAPTPAPALPLGCQEGVLPSGGLSLICIPTSGWNGDLLVWAHGYVAFNEPLGFRCV